MLSSICTTVFVLGTMFSGAAFAETPSKPTPKGTVQGPGIIAIGSPLTFGGNNDPDTYSAATTFSSTPVLVDNGKVKIWQEQVPTGPNAEWDLFYMQTVDGGPLAGNINANWDVIIAYTLTQPVYFDAVVHQFLANGTPVSPLTDVGGTDGICCAVPSNPILPGWSYYKSGFSGALPAGTQQNWDEIHSYPYSFLSTGGIDPNKANELIFGLHFTLQDLPNVTGVISASAFGALPNIAPGGWIEIYGTNLAAMTQTWGSSDFNGVDAPTTLGQTSVTIGGLPAYVDYISSLQVNVQVPAGVSPGSQPLVVTTVAGSSDPFPVTVDATEPGLLAPSNFKVGGTQYVVAQFADGTYVAPPGSISGVTSERAKPGDTIVIYGVGFGSVTPDIPPGQLAEQTNTLAAQFTFSIGGQTAKVDYKGLVPGYVGLYQFNVEVPSSVPANDTTPLTFSLGGVSGAQTLAIAIGN